MQAVVRDAGSIPGSGKFPWWRAWQSTPVFLPREFYGQRSLACYSQWGQKEVNMTEQLIHFQKLKIFWNYLKLFFWKYLYDGIIGIQRIYNKLYTLIYWASVSIQEVVTIKIVNKSIRPKYLSSPASPSLTHSKETATTSLLLVTIYGFALSRNICKINCAIHNILFLIISFSIIIIIMNY